MAQIKFLSQRGLQTLWNRIREIFSTKEESIALNQEVAKSIAEVNNNLAENVAALSAVDESMTQHISAETDARVAADNSLDNKIDTNTSLLSQQIDSVTTSLSQNIASVQSSLTQQVNKIENEVVYQHGTIYNNLANYAGFITRFREDASGLAITTIEAEDNSDPRLNFYRTGIQRDAASPQPIYMLGTGSQVIDPSNYGGCIKSLTIDGSVKIISGNAFPNAGLEEVNFAKYGVTHISYQAFEENSFTSVTLPYSLVMLGDYNFRNCKNLKYVTLNCEYIPTLGEGIFLGCDALKAIYVPSFLVDKYKEAWPEYADLIQPKGENSGSQEEIDKVNERIDNEVVALENEIEELKALIGLDYTNVSEVGA